MPRTLSIRLKLIIKSSLCPSMKNVCELHSPSAWDAVRSLAYVDHLQRLASSEAQGSTSLLPDLLFLSSSSMYGVDPTHREHRCSCSIKASETSCV